VSWQSVNVDSKEVETKMHIETWEVMENSGQGLRTLIVDYATSAYDPSTA